MKEYYILIKKFNSIYPISTYLIDESFGSPEEAEEYLLNDDYIKKERNDMVYFSGDDGDFDLQAFVILFKDSVNYNVKK